MWICVAVSTVWIPERSGWMSKTPIGGGNLSDRAVHLCEGCANSAEKENLMVQNSLKYKLKKIKYIARCFLIFIGF